MDSRDIIISLALEYDLPTLLNYCRTSKRINDLVCNNNLFWVSKLKKDFKIILTDLADVKKAKTYYQEISELMTTDWNAWNIYKFYYHAASNNRLDLVKIALDSGADINYTPSGYSPLLRAFVFDRVEIFDYLLERGAVDSKDKAVLNVKSFLDYFASSHRERQIQIATVLYDKIFPKMYQIAEFKKFWKLAALEFLERHREIMPDLYNKHIEKIRELATN